MSPLAAKVLFPAWGALQSVLDWLKHNVAGFLLGPYAGPLFLAVSTFLAVQLAFQPHRIKERIVTKIERQIEKVKAKEVVRRETVLKKVQVRSLADIREIDRLQTRLANLQTESNRASTSLDAVACLPADSVMRLSAVH